jgi:hypothetical protein
MGLNESVGKTYWSREFLEINSTNFFYNRESQRTFQDQIGGRTVIRQTPYTQVKFVNAGLLVGLKRSGGAISLAGRQEPYDDIGTRYRELLRMAPTHLHEQVHRAFIKHHQSLLDKVNPLPWHAPTWIGGLGMTGLKELSEIDLRIARMILLNWKTKRPRDLGTIRDIPWKVWKLAEKRVPEPDYTEENDSNGEKVYLSTMADQCINLLFDSNVSLEDLHPDVNPDEESNKEANEIKQLIRHNRSLWDPARYKGLGAPIDQERLIFKPLYPTYRRNANVQNSSQKDKSLSHAQLAQVHLD